MSGGDTRRTISAQDFLQLFLIAIKDVLGQVDVFQGVAQIGPVEEVVLLEAPGLLDLDDIIIDDLEDPKLLFHLVGRDQKEGRDAGGKQEIPGENRDRSEDAG